MHYMHFISMSDSTALSAYLKANGIRQRDFAAVIGVTQATISRLANRDISPSIALAAKIRAATNGAVDWDSWLPPETSEDAA